MQKSKPKQRVYILNTFSKEKRQNHERREHNGKNKSDLAPSKAQVSIQVDGRIDHHKSKEKLQEKVYLISAN